MTDALLADLRALAYASSDGTEYEHNEGCTGEAECPACWAKSIRDLITKHTPEPDVSERDELTRVVTYAYFNTDRQPALMADVILAAGWRRR